MKLTINLRKIMLFKIIYYLVGTTLIVSYWDRYWIGHICVCLVFFGSILGAFNIFGDD